VEPDFLLWTVVDVPATFAKKQVPDSEHLCLGILLLEGFLTDVASANCDGLMEAAVDELTSDSPDALRVCVTTDDLREPRLLGRLIKFHGCAMRAAADPTEYRTMLIARQSQITDWRNNGDYATIRHELVGLAATRHTLMIGLSAQDTDIQEMFAEAGALMTWEWPCDPPAYVFAEDTLGQDQLNILRVAYKDAYDDNVVAVETSALLRAYAKPALAALVLHALCSKLKAYVRCSNAPRLAQDDFDRLDAGLESLRDRVAAAA
jgi:hypothetical protein